MKKLLRSLFAGSLLVVPVFGASFSFTSVTTGQPTFNRPTLTSGNVTTFTTQSGQSVAYSAQALNITTPGVYTFSSNVFAASFASWNNALFLYSGSFNPTNPLANAVIGQSGGLNSNVGYSYFNYNILTSGTYILVTTGLVNGAMGTAAGLATGPGIITAGSPVPEPGSTFLVGIGLLLAGALRFKAKLPVFR